MYLIRNWKFLFLVEEKKEFIMSKKSALDLNLILIFFYFIKYLNNWAHFYFVVINIIIVQIYYSFIFMYVCNNTEIVYNFS